MLSAIGQAMSIPPAGLYPRPATMDIRFETIDRHWGGEAQLEDAGLALDLPDGYHTFAEPCNGRPVAVLRI